MVVSVWLVVKKVRYYYMGFSFLFLLCYIFFFMEIVYMFLYRDFNFSLFFMLFCCKLIYMNMFLRFSIICIFW